MKPDRKQVSHDDRGLIASYVGDGRPLLVLTGLCLIFSGAFALFLSFARQFLPHDVAFLGMTPASLCSINECRIVHFMIHDRVSFGGALIAIGTLYLWLAEFPLRRAEAWAWWVFAISGLLGFGSFLAYLGYGYLDSWHGTGTLVLLPCFLVGLIRSASLVDLKRGPRCLFEDPPAFRPISRVALGRACLFATSLGLVGGGLTITLVGMTSVFVPQDLVYMGMSAQDLLAINAHLVPLIAHDRAGFGGAVLTCGVMVFFCVWHGTYSRGLWQAFAIAGAFGFSTAIGIHPIIGYVDFVHLAPAVLGALIFSLGMILIYPEFSKHDRRAVSSRSGVTGSTAHFPHRL